MKVKLFECMSIGDLERKINGFFKERAMHIHSISFSVGELSYTAMIMYSEV